MFKQKITLFCRNDDDFIPYVIENVFFTSANAKSAFRSTPHINDMAMLVIPEKSLANYVPNSDWHLLSQQEKQKHFTLKLDDVFASGDCKEDFDKKIQNGEMFVITNVAEFLHGSALSHFEISAGNARRYGGGIL